MISDGSEALRDPAGVPWHEVTKVQYRRREADGMPGRWRCGSMLPCVARMG